MLAKCRRFTHQPSDRSDQRRLILDLLQSPDGADDHLVVTVEIRRHQAGGLGGRRCESRCIDTVVDLSDAGRRDANACDKVFLEVLRDRHIPMDERAVQAAQQSRSWLGPFQVVHIPAVFAVDSAWNTGHKGRGQGVEARQVAAVKDRRATGLERRMNAPIQLQRGQRRPSHREHLDVRPLDPIPEIREILDAHHAMAIAIARHPIDQVDDAVLQPAHPQVVNDVNDEGGTAHMIGVRS